MLYIYSKKTKDITKMDDAIVLDSDKMDNLIMVHKEDLRNNFGEIIVNPATNEPEYKPNYVSIVVDKATNNFTRVNTKGEDDENTYYTDVLFKDYVNYTSIDVYNKVAKFYNNQFYMFEIQEEYDYKAEDNSWVLSIEKYKKKIIKKIENSEDELRHHGFYHSLFSDGKMYLQPFRNVTKDNDQATFLGLKIMIPQAVRKVKIFVEDANGNRATDPGTFYWVANGQLSDIILESISTLIIAYSESVKQGIKMMSRKVQNLTDLEQLKDIDKKYIQMILLGMKQAIEGVPENLALLKHNMAKIKAENPTLVKDTGTIFGGM